MKTTPRPRRVPLTTYLEDDPGLVHAERPLWARREDQHLGTEWIARAIAMH